MRSHHAHLRPRACAWAARLLALTTLVAAGGCSSHDAGADTDKAPKEEAPILVRTVAVETGDLTRGLRATATLESEHSAALSLQTAGLVTEVHADIGDLVEAGAELVVLDEDRLQLAADEAELAEREAGERERDAKLAVNEAERALETADIGKREAQRNLERLQDLAQKSLVSEGELDAARFSTERAAVAVESATVAGSRARLAGELATTAKERSALAHKRARLDLQNARMKAPFAGVITQRSVRAGEQASVGQVLFELVDAKNLRAPVYLPQKNLGLLRPGMSVEVHADAQSDLVGHGSVERLPRTVDPATGNVRLDVRLTDSEGFLEGMFVTLRLVIDRREGVPVVPKKAVRLEDGEAMVYRVVEGKAREVRFTPGLEDRDRLEVLGGALAPGDRVVLVGIDQLSDGSPVREAAESAAEDETAGR